MLDCIIRNGSVIDGSGKPAVKADIGITEGKILEISPDLKGSAKNELNVEGLSVSPGFIDIHSHSDFSLRHFPKAESKIFQGVTTEVVGNCGFAMGPVTDEHFDDSMLFFRSASGMMNLPTGKDRWAWNSMMDYHRKTLIDGTSVNIALLVGHGSLRCAAMGFNEGQPTSDQLEKMMQLLKTELDQGAFGLSCGLIYHPGAFADIAELTELNKLVSAVGGVFSLHMRSEGHGVIPAIQEALEISRKSGVSLQISHLKCELPANWGKSEEILKMLDKAQSEGINVDFDQYPYTAWCTGMLELFPSWAKNKGPVELIKQFNNPAVKQKIIKGMTEPPYDWENPMDGLEWDQAYLTGFKKEHNLDLEGRNLAEIAEVRKTSPAHTACDLFTEEEGKLSLIVFSMCEEDLQRIVSHPSTMISSDGLAIAPDRRMISQKVHPRWYGSFPRVLGRYVREKQIISIETAISKMTSLPARKMGIHDRGLLEKGKIADITIFDSATINDVASFGDPHKYASGIHYVFVNGQPVINQGRHTGKTPGQILSHSN